MVSKIIKTSPTKAPKATPKKLPHQRSGRKKSSPLKDFAAAAASSLDRSLRSCRRRLLKVFARLAILGCTPTKLRKHGFRSLKTAAAPESLVAPLANAAAVRKLLPPPMCPEKKTVFLDLDETLVHSKTDTPTSKYNFEVQPMINGQVITFYVLKRPGVDQFLKELAKSFEIIVFTAGLKEYASLVLDRLDPEGELISHRLYRDSCREMEGKFVKDLSTLGRDLDKVAIVDDNPNAYLFQMENAVPVSPFLDDLGDRELQRVTRFFEIAAHFNDMRDAVAYYLSKSGDQKTLKLDCNINFQFGEPSTSGLR